VTQDTQTGANNLEKALAVSMGLPYQKREFVEEDISEYEMKL